MGFKDPNPRLVLLCIHPMGAQVLCCCSLLSSHVRSPRAPTLDCWSLTPDHSLLYRNGLPYLRLRLIIAYIALGVTYTAVALTILLSCQPMHKFWQVSPDPGRLCQPTNSPVNVLVVVIPNILTDIYLLSIPLPVSPSDRQSPAVQN